MRKTNYLSHSEDNVVVMSARPCFLQHVSMVNLVYFICAFAQEIMVYRVYAIMVTSDQW